MKNKCLIYCWLTISSLATTTPVTAQINVFFDVLYELNFIFGFEGEPRARDTEFTFYPYDLYDDGRYRPIGEAGRNSSVKAQILFQSNERELMGGYGQLQFSPLSTITLNLNHTQLFENRLRDETFKTGISNFSFQYNRIRNRRFNVWWDVGLTRFEEENVNWGISGGAGLSWFFKQPLSAHVNYRYHDFLDGSQNGLSVLELKLKLHLKRYFISTGYQNLSNALRANSWMMGGGIYF